MSTDNETNDAADEADEANEANEANEAQARALLAAALPEVTDAELLALRARLGARAEAAGVLDVAYRTVDTPVGSLLLAATGAGLVRVAYPVQGHDQVLQALAAQVSPRILHAPARLDAAARQIDEYFAGTRRGLTCRWTSAWRTASARWCCATCQRSRYGRTASYAVVAAAAGSPRAVRAVGTACATNPLPVVVPCHRVIRSDGSLGGYAGGPAAEQALLSLELEAA